MEIENAILQDLEIFRKGRIFKNGYGKVFEFLLFVSWYCFSSKAVCITKCTGKLSIIKNIMQGLSFSACDRMRTHLQTHKIKRLIALASYHIIVI